MFDDDVLEKQLADHRDIIVDVDRIRSAILGRPVRFIRANWGLLTVAFVMSAFGATVEWLASMAGACY